MKKPYSIYLAEDDEDYSLLFTDALQELPILTQITILGDGEELMNSLLCKNIEIPDVLFLDINMPKKNGYECLSEIKQHNRLRSLPIIILSTSFNSFLAEQLYQLGAKYCLQKPAGFNQFKLIIYKTLKLLNKEGQVAPKKSMMLIES